MDFLRKVGISDDTIKRIIDNNSHQCLFNLECNQEECLRIISFMKNIGIKTVDELLIYLPEIFIQPISTFMKKLARYDILEIIRVVNDEPLLIENYLESLKEA